MGVGSFWPGDETEMKLRELSDIANSLEVTGLGSTVSFSDGPEAKP